MARDGVGELAELLATQPTDWETTFWAMDCAKITATESVSTADGATSVSSIARVKLCGVLPWGGVISSRHYDAAGTAFTGRGSHYTHRTIGMLTDFDPVAKRATYRVQVQHGSRTYEAATYSECIGRATASDDHNPSLSRHLSVCARSVRLCRTDHLGQGQAIGDVHITTAAVRIRRAGTCVGICPACDPVRQRHRRLSAPSELVCNGHV